LRPDDLDTRRRDPESFHIVKPIWESVSEIVPGNAPATQSDDDGLALIAVRTAPRLLPMPTDSQVRSADTLIPLQAWEGAVLNVGVDSFTARLVDTAGEHPDEEIDLSKDELSPFDLDLLEPGAIFYWTIGYRQQLPVGARERVSRIRFRRLPAWSNAELTVARERADDLAHDLGW
jgi:hypothetical protein